MRPLFTSLSATLHSLSHLLIISSLLTTLSMSFLACDNENGNGFRISQSGLLQVNPERLIFSVLTTGQEEIRDLSLNNNGSADLVISSFEIIQSRDQFSILNADGAVVSTPLTIGPDERVTLQVKYLADDQGIDGNEEVLITTNSGSQREVSVPIITSDAVPVILESRADISFDSVDAGESAQESVRLTNVGQATLFLSEMILANTDFSAVVLDAMGEEIAPVGEFDPAISIESGSSVEVVVTYSPMVAGADLSELKIVSNDPERPNLTIPIRANGAAPCIQVTPTSLDFGAGLLVPSRDDQTPNIREVLIESCGGTNLKITSIEFEGNSFGLTSSFEPFSEEVAIQLPAASSDAALPALAFAVGFWPLEEMNYGGRMRLYTNTAAEPVVVDLFGRGVENACPIPVVTSELYEVAPLDVITLDGSPSTDPGGEVRRWVWSVVERPSGSVSQVFESLTSLSDPAGGGPADDEMTPTGVFFVDLAGRYTIELQVYDNLDQVSCEPNSIARVEIEAVPDKDLHIQLVWSTPEDPDETDQSGTDIDLHFKHQNAEERWGSAASTWDCYYNNKAPDWGSVGDILDNPSLDIDDVNGAGPENINLNQPEVGVTYDVGALYFRSQSTFGEAGRDSLIDHVTYASVRMFARGELIAEFVDRELNVGSQLWHVMSISWCEDELRCPEVDVVDRVYEEGEYID